ncbi:head GIN domain-containing protein [Sphingomonas sp. GB1N7]|uniref:head GIN domain-containing protein n=1 Tax=Parasphingomonas caseinilytica TaxID=3096158 RepID=UPI002FCC5926
MRFIILAALPLAACSFGSNGHDSKPGVAGTGNGSARTFAVSDFTGVTLRGSDDVDVRVGTGFSVRAEGPSEELDKLKIERDGDELKIGRIDKNGMGWIGGNNSKAKVTVYVTMPRVAKANIAGSGNMTIDRVEGQAFDANTAGSGDLSIAALSVEKGTFDIAGSGGMKLAGSVRALEVSIAGSGDVDAAGVKSDGAEVSIAGSGSVKADVTGAAKVSIVGSGDADLGKGAKCSVSKIGSGDANCG